MQKKHVNWEIAEYGMIPTRGETAARNDLCQCLALNIKVEH